MSDDRAHQGMGLGPTTTVRDLIFPQYFVEESDHQRVDWERPFHTLEKARAWIATLVCTSARHDFRIIKVTKIIKVHADIKTTAIISEEGSTRKRTKTL